MSTSSLSKVGPRLISSHGQYALDNVAPSRYLDLSTRREIFFVFLGGPQLAAELAESFGTTMDGSIAVFLVAEQYAHPDLEQLERLGAHGLPRRRGQDRGVAGW